MSEKNELPVVAWMDDGQQMINGTVGLTYRIVTSKAKANMLRSAMEPYIYPLVRLSDAQARIADLQAQVEGLRADAQRYNAFFDAGLPITFLGQPYYTKADLNEAIDSARAGREDGNG